MEQTPRLRPEQAAIVDSYTGGLVGIAAVPGSGKTFTLAHLAARLVATQQLLSTQEVLIVTFTNTAANSFKSRIAGILQDQYRIVPYVGYRVRTLHGLAHDIVRERPALVGLSDDFGIVDERVAQEILREIVAGRLDVWLDRLEVYLDSDVDRRRARANLQHDLPDMVLRFIKYAKDFRQTPGYLLGNLPGDHPDFLLAQFAIDIFSDYERALKYRGAVDFDDLVRLALEALERDEDYLQRLRERWAFILEDEAQDSSQLQEDMLRYLSDNRNWVRVGDPNQAINTTFTTADPAFLLDFLNVELNPGVIEYPLTASGRSSLSIISLANHLVHWCVTDHPVLEIRRAFEQRFDGVGNPLRGVIRPLREDDPQSNPPDGMIAIDYEPSSKLTPEQELERIVSGEDYSVAVWHREIQALPEDERPTAAVLVPRNDRGFKVVDLLRKHGIPYEELLRSTTATRETVQLLQNVLAYLAEPTHLRNLKRLFWDILSPVRRDEVRSDVELRKQITALFSRFKRIEELLWPRASGTLLDWGIEGENYDWVADELERFRSIIRRWLEALVLPVDQLILLIAQDIFVEPVDLALSHKVALLMRNMIQTHPDWRLPHFVEELRAISNNQRRFLGFDSAEAGYEPKPGVVTVATMHAAKGLEWDRVYLLSVSNYDFPSGAAYDAYVGEKWYVRGNDQFLLEHLNLEAELQGQLQSMLENPFEYVEGKATVNARVLYVQERLRLLYVGITRARTDLVVTWNMGRYWQKGRESQPALALIPLHSL